jgi:hypothetical protein
MKAYEPHVHVELAELARLSGDERAWRDELSKAHRLFTGFRHLHGALAKLA